ncbi:hypothetical protein ACL5HQ_04580 [Stenotrophomonas maltophilia]
MNTPKTPAKRGRKPKHPSEKPAQLTIRLDPRTLFGLDVVARDRRTSLSGAAEYLIHQQLQEYAVEGANVLDVLDRMAEKASPGYVPEAGNAVSEEQRRDAWINEIVRTDAGRALFMPRQLLQPQERYFRDLYEGILSSAVERDEYRGGLLLLSGVVLQRMYDMAKEYEQERKPIPEAVDRFYEMMAAADALKLQGL